MGPTAACVDTMEMIMKSWISPHLFWVRLTGLVVFECALGVGCMYVGGRVVTLLADACTP